MKNLPAKSKTRRAQLQAQIDAINENKASTNAKLKEESREVNEERTSKNAKVRTTASKETRKDRNELSELRESVSEEKRKLTDTLSTNIQSLKENYADEISSIRNKEDTDVSSLKNQIKEWRSNTKKTVENIKETMSKELSEETGKIWDDDKFTEDIKTKSKGSGKAKAIRSNNVTQVKQTSKPRAESKTRIHEWKSAVEKQRERIVGSVPKKKKRG